MLLLVFGAHASPYAFDAPRSLQLYDLWARAEVGESGGAAAALSHGASWAGAAAVEGSASWRGVEQWRFAEATPTFRESLDVAVSSRAAGRPGAALTVDVADGPWGTAALLGRVRWSGPARALELRAGPALGVDIDAANPGARITLDSFANLSPRVAFGGWLRSDLWFSGVTASDSVVAFGVRAWPTARWESEVYVGGLLLADADGVHSSAWSEGGVVWWGTPVAGLRASVGGAVDDAGVLAGWAFGGVSVRWSRARSAPRPRAEVHVFRYRNATATDVAILGSFTGWEPVPLVAGPDGEWTAELVLPPGRSEYVYVVDGVVQVPTDADRLVDDGFGGRSGVVDGP